jgi:uridine phosphorylase
VDYLGKHTTLSYIVDRPEIWSRIPYLNENEGKSPPFIIVVGDRRRVWKVAERLSKVVFLDQAATQISSEIDGWKESPSAKAEYGRVAMALGTYESVPILVAEIQMGSYSAQIILNEILSDNLVSKQYIAEGQNFDADYKYVIRVGTCGGINCSQHEQIREGDIINSTFAIGASTAILQSTARLDTWRIDSVEPVKEAWLGLGSGFSLTKDGHPKAHCSSVVVDAINKAASAKGIRCFQGGAVTKDSLYAELSENLFVELCRRHSARSTEDALSTIAAVCTRKGAKFGMVAGAIGLIPGSSFTESESVKDRAEKRAIELALEAMRMLGNRPG